MRSSILQMSRTVAGNKIVAGNKESVARPERSVAEKRKSVAQTSRTVAQTDQSVAGKKAVSDRKSSTPVPNPPYLCLSQACYVLKKINKFSSYTKCDISLL